MGTNKQKRWSPLKAERAIVEKRAQLLKNLQWKAKIKIWAKKLIPCSRVSGSHCRLPTRVEDNHLIVATLTFQEMHREKRVYLGIKLKALLCVRLAAPERPQRNAFNINSTIWAELKASLKCSRACASPCRLSTRERTTPWPGPGPPAPCLRRSPAPDHRRPRQRPPRPLLLRARRTNRLSRSSVFSPAVVFFTEFVEISGVGESI